MKPLTDRQESILSYIESYRRKNGGSPTYGEIQSHFGFASPNAVLDHIRALLKKGYVKIRAGSRGLLSLRPDQNKIPLLGTIAAGVPIEAVENIESELDLSTLGLENSSRQYFALRVKGESMINAHILDGDIVVIQKQPMIRSNEIAAVLWNGEATLKYVKHSGNHVLLVPANDAFEPMTVSPEKIEMFSILGKVVRVIRNV
jgi:repressor LexA